MNKKYTPENITHLEPDDIFVFGSNLDGLHMGGAARVAYEKFGAVWGQGVGIQGQSYAIPTMQGGVETIKPYVDQFIELAREWDQNTFYVTRIGCGIAGFTDEEIAPSLMRLTTCTMSGCPNHLLRLSNATAITGNKHDHADSTAHIMGSSQPLIT